MRPLCGISGMKSLLEAAASSSLLPLQELAECDFSVCESNFGWSGSLYWRLYLAWSPFNFLKKSTAVVLAVGTGKQSCELSQSSGKCRLQRFQLGVFRRQSQ